MTVGRVEVLGTEVQPSAATQGLRMSEFLGVLLVIQSREMGLERLFIFERFIFCSS